MVTLSYTQIAGAGAEAGTEAGEETGAVAETKTPPQVSIKERKTTNFEFNLVEKFFLSQI